MTLNIMASHAVTAPSTALWSRHKVSIWLVGEQGVLQPATLPQDLHRVVGVHPGEEQAGISLLAQKITISKCLSPRPLPVIATPVRILTESMPHQVLALHAQVTGDQGEGHDQQEDGHYAV